MTSDEHVRIQAKRMMRRRFRGLRASMPAHVLEARSHAICERLLEQVASARVIALFWPIERNHEVDLREADEKLRAAGRIVVYPSIDQETNAMTFRVVADTTLLEERGLGFAEPPPDAAVPERIDVIVVPGIAFDATGHRLGYGAGYYDRTLPAFRPPARAIGVAFDFQLAADIPHDDSDVAVDMIVTDRRVLNPC
ncbi:MAG TPA: 5-formyltetrahydrofolate cyclo-ligase [Polyangiaceae bacterium]|nr:5-formyltetrahydrofolate cyclo-ligase [Polyangiaceae bacterium]